MNKLPSVPLVVDFSSGIHFDLKLPNHCWFPVAEIFAKHDFFFSDSARKMSDRSRKKRKKKKKHHSHSKTNSLSRPSALKRKSSDLREESGSSRKRSMNVVARKGQEKEPQVVLFIIVRVVQSATHYLIFHTWK